MKKYANSRQIWIHDQKSACREIQDTKSARGEI